MPRQRTLQDDPSAKTSGTKRKRRSADVRKGRLRVHNPFELIRWLALSQPDPRKALAELVQNSLDADARTIRVTRVRQKGVPCLRIWDDGEGVIPELSRVEALKYIATHIGHSRKRSLTPQQRLELMTQGRYGIGLLGFWSLGEVLELRTSIPGQGAKRLILYRDRPDYLIEPLRGRLPLDERWTEALVVGLHRQAMQTLIARRAAEFLASELRGQLLAREVDLTVHDRMARGRAPKLISVRPRRFLGECLEGIGPLQVAGYPPLQLEIYLAGESRQEEPQGLSVYAAGTLVAESFHELASLDLDHAPWTDPRLTGLVDFPALTVAPGSRRGIVPDAAAGAFARALLDAEPQLQASLEGYERRCAEELDRALIRDLQRAFRGFYNRRPRYTMLPVQGKEAQGGGPEDPAGANPGPASDAAEGGQPGVALEPPGSEPLAEMLFPPGPLAEVRITPSPLRVQCGGRRRAAARALDAAGHRVEQPVTFRWTLSGSVGELDPAAEHSWRVEVVAAEQPAVGGLAVVARAGTREAVAEVVVEVLEELPGRQSDEGIPEPELVDQPSAAWRSRLLEDRWQVNSGHPEYREIANRPALKLRYLAALFAKEIVLRSSQDPRLEGPLEQMVEVFSYADRQVSQRRSGRRKK